jgi:hypothetical protein
VIWPGLLAAVYPVLFSGSGSTELTKVSPPGIRYRMNMAMATSAPWVDSNMWRYRRDPEKSYVCDVKQKSVVVAMAEGFSLDVRVALEIAPGQQKDYDSMLAFLKGLPDGPKTRWTNFTVTDDRSAPAGELMNLLSRRNLMYRIASNGDYALNSRISNPYEYVQEMREKLGDEKRVIRIFGSELTLVELTRDGNRVRLQLLNYGSRPVEDLRIRIKGHYKAGAIQAYVYRSTSPRLEEFTYDGKFTEFTLDALPTYAVLDFTT